MDACTMRTVGVIVTFAAVVVAAVVAAPASEAETSPTSVPGDPPPGRDILTPAQWKQLDQSVDRALAWLASQQRHDGSFPTRDTGQPGVTALCVLAFLSRGHSPGEGRYGTVIDNGIAYVLQCQNTDGLIARVHPAVSRGIRSAQCAAYNHAIGGLMLSEVYGTTSGDTHRRIRAAIEAALSHTLGNHPSPKRQPEDEGGWRYEKRWQSSDSDLSVTSWHLMFLRSCKNAGFDVPAQAVDKALAFVQRCYDPRTRTFWYALRGSEHVTTRAMTGAGILSLSLGGRHQTEPARHAGEWLLRHPFDVYRAQQGQDRFFYGAFYCTQAMFQLGGRYWSEFYPTLAHTLVTHQREDGSWDVEPAIDFQYGNTYTTALSVLALTTVDQLLPIFQR